MAGKANDIPVEVKVGEPTQRFRQSFSLEKFQLYTRLFLKDSERETALHARCYARTV